MTTPTEPVQSAWAIAHEPPDVRLDKPGDLIAAIPHVLGFHPVDSLVVVGLRGHVSTTLGVVLRVDLPPPVRPAELADQLLGPLIQQRSIGAALVVVGAHEYTLDEELPHRAVVRECETVFADVGIPVLHQLWAPDTAGGAQWRCYEDTECAGVVPDPNSSALAAASVTAGVVTYNRREDITATLAPADDDTLARRADLLAAASRRAEPDQGALGRGVERFHAVLAAIDRAMDGVLPSTDEELVDLALAVGDHRVRDTCLVMDGESRAAAAERLWTTLVRGVPAPERAEPACLLAFAAYLRGDGVLAGIALDTAAAADSGHRLSDLLRNALWTGLPPTRLRVAVQRAAERARNQLTDQLTEEMP